MEGLDVYGLGVLMKYELGVLSFLGLGVKCIHLSCLRCFVYLDGILEVFSVLRFKFFGYLVNYDAIIYRKCIY